MKRRKTQAKTMILESLKASSTALSHDMLQDKFDGQIDRATIYRVLNRFCEDGLAHKVVGDDGRQYFALCYNCQGERHEHNHLHFRCLTCGKVECLPNEIALGLPEGYQAENFNGFVSGCCPSCSNR